MKTAKLTVLFLGIVLTISAQEAAGQSVVNVGPPSGKDDTANIQAALNDCVAHGPGCVVQLLAGRYLTRQLVAYNFRGTFKGMGKDRTTIEALPYLPVVLLDPVTGGECMPNTTTCPWPDLIIFVDGDIRVSDLSIRITASPGTATAPWLGFTTLLDALRFMGQNPMDVSIDRISIEGLPDNSSSSFGIVLGFPVGFNVVNEIIYAGEFPRSTTPFDYYFLSGSLTVRNSFFNMAVDGVSLDGLLRSNHITIGGSPSTGNHFENVIVGMDMESAEKSDIEISHNVSSGIVAGMWVIPWQSSVFIPSSPSRYLIHDNTFIGTGKNAEGFYFLNEPTHPWIHAAAWSNVVELQDALSEGIGAYNTESSAIADNSVTGTDGLDAVGLHNSTLSTVIRNSVSDFTVDSSVGNAQIYLDPSTSEDLVICSEPSDTVLNQGTNNAVIGCQQPATTGSVAPASAAPRPNLPKGKSFLH